MFLVVPISVKLSQARPSDSGHSQLTSCSVQKEKGMNTLTHKLLLSLYQDDKLEVYVKSM